MLARIDRNKCRIAGNKCRIAGNKCRIAGNKCRIAGYSVSSRSPRRLSSVRASRRETCI
jgi:hypothetical protein